LGTEKQISLAPDKVQELLNGTLSNNGFIIMTDPELNDRFNYKSSDSSTSSNRPKLVIQYSLNGPITPTDTPTAMPPTSTPTSTTTVTNTPTPTATFTPTPPPVPVFSQADFTYDGDGHRVKSVITTDIASTTTYFVGNHYEVTGAEVTKYYYAGSQRIAMRKNGTLNYILGDHLGSTSLVTDAAGVIMSEQQYKAWGETRSSSGTEVTKYQYTGQYSYASDFGLMFYNARWYDSSLGRFAQADTIVPGGVQGYDRYAYTNNNPIKYTDPSGHESGDCYDRGYCTKKYQLRKDFDNFDKVPTYNKKEMKPVQFIYGITKEFNPDEYSLFQKEDGKIDQQKLLRYGVISDKAIKTATSLFPDDENPDGMRNAFQHAYWNALLTKEFGIEFAEAITNSHEKNYDAKRETQFMDLYNNAVGRRLGENSDSKDSMVLLAVVYNAVLRGDMIVLEKNKSKYDVYFSDDCVGSCISP
jgi:RHS repeat-associated protein